MTTTTELAVAAVRSTELTLPGSISETGLELPANLSFEDWQQTGETLGRIGRSCQWWIGDWLNYGERVYGEKYTEAIEATGYELATLKDFAYVAAHVEMSVRTDVLSFTHHKQVAALGPAEQERWLGSAEANGWSVGKLRKQIKAKADGRGGRPQGVTNSGNSDPTDEPELVEGEVVDGTKAGETTPYTAQDRRADRLIGALSVWTRESLSDTNALTAVPENTDEFLDAVEQAIRGLQWLRKQLNGRHQPEREISKRKAKATTTADNNGTTPHFLPDLSDENAEENLRTQAIHLFEQGRRVASLLAADTAFVCRSKADRKTVIADADRLIGVATNLKESITCENAEVIREKSFEITTERQQQIADKKPPTFYFGKGDKWKESTEPLHRYLRAWEKRGFEFAHLNPREAAGRVKRIDGLIDALIAARADLEPRSEKATLTFQGKAR